MSFSDPTPPPQTTTTTSGTEDVVVVAINEMKDRGIINPEELLGFASPDAILGACRWWDQQHSAGPGMLAKVIREGGMIERSKRRERQFTRSEIDAMAARVGRPFTEHERELIAERRAARARR